MAIRWRLLSFSWGKFKKIEFTISLKCIVNNQYELFIFEEYTFHFCFFVKYIIHPLDRFLNLRFQYQLIHFPCLFNDHEISFGIFLHVKVTCGANQLTVYLAFILHEKLRVNIVMEILFDLCLVKFITLLSKFFLP